MMGWIDTKRPPTFSVDGLGNDMGFSDLARERSAPADCFRCKVRWDRRASVARGAAPCTEQRDAKQPGQSTVRAVCLAERTYSRQGSIEVRHSDSPDVLQHFSRCVILPVESTRNNRLCCDNRNSTRTLMKDTCSKEKASLILPDEIHRISLRF